MTPLVCRLDDVEAGMSADVGAKAFGLSRLRRLVPVPDAVCLTTAFCVPILERLRQRRGAAGGETALGDLQILTGEERDLLLQCTRTFDGAPFSVRSSFVGEDGATASFAGMFRSVLNVREHEAIAAFLHVVTSALSNHVRVYAERKARLEALKPAAVMQRMLFPEVSGVMFTTNPLGDQGEIVIEAAYGLGETVVAGGVTPDLLLFRKSDHAVVHRERGSKRKAVLPRAEGGVAAVDVSESDRARQCLPDDVASELARTGARLEQHFGGPQDVEWALEKGKLWFLQSRPVTVFQKTAAVGVH